MKKLIFLSILFCVGGRQVSTFAQQYYDNRYFYDEEFDWHWDIRVRISDGHKEGWLTNWEANRLYRRLEQIEKKEYRYMADGHYGTWEQDDIWEDVIWLNRQVGLELRDYDRRFYGFDDVYLGFNTYPFWYERYYGDGWNFYRFDNQGWGSCRLGYVPRSYYPQTNVYVNKNYYGRPSNRPYDPRSNGNVVIRDRTDPANRVRGNTERYRRGSNTPAYGGRPQSRSSEYRKDTPERQSSTQRQSYESGHQNRYSTREAEAVPSGRSATERSPRVIDRSESRSRRLPGEGTSTAPRSSERSSSPSSERSSSPSPERSSSPSPQRSSSPSPELRSSPSPERSSSPSSAPSSSPSPEPRSSSRGPR